MLWLLLVLVLAGDESLKETYDLEEYSGHFFTDLKHRGDQTVICMLQFDKKNPMSLRVDKAFFDYKTETFTVLTDGRAKDAEQVFLLGQRTVFFSVNHGWATILDKDFNFESNTSIHELMALPKNMKGRILNVDPFGEDTYIATYEDKGSHKLLLWQPAKNSVAVVKNIKSRNGFGHRQWIAVGKDLFLVERDIAMVSLLGADYKSIKTLAPEREPTIDATSGMKNYQTGRKDRYTTILNVVKGHDSFMEARWLRFYDENGENDPPKQVVLRVSKEGFEVVKQNRRFISAHAGKSLYFYGDDQEFKLEKGTAE